jgi:5'(3')-deoxyribonucleotidase
MKLPLIVVFDMDDTVYDFTAKVFEKYNAEFDDSVDPAKVTDQKWDSHIKKGVGAEARVRSYFAESGFFYSLKPFPWAVSAIGDAEHRGIAKHFFVSMCRTKTGAYDKMEAINRDFPFIGSERVLITGGKKHVVKGHLFIDDTVHHIRDYAFENPEAVTCVFDRPHNASIKAPHERMTSWANYYNLLRKVAKIDPV